MADKEQAAANEGMATMTNSGGGVVDNGTGAYDPPPAEVTYESNISADPTGAVDPPPAEVTVESPAGPEVTESTGAVDGPPAEQTFYEWPAQAPAEKTTKAAGKKAVTAAESDVEDKAVQPSRTTKK